MGTLQTIQVKSIKTNRFREPTLSVNRNAEQGPVGYCTKRGQNELLCSKTQSWAVRVPFLEVSNSEQGAELQLGPSEIELQKNCK